MTMTMTMIVTMTMTMPMTVPTESADEQMWKAIQYAWNHAVL